MENIIRFGNTNKQFFPALRSRVDSYFKTNNISRNANYKMVIKTIVMLSIYLVPYSLMVFNVFPFTGWQVIGLFLIMGVGMAGIGFSIMHDANHGSYSKNPKINQMLSYTMYMLGGSPLNWQIQHNVLHHTYTNISGKDEDIDAPIWLLRFSPHDPHYKIQRFQHLYAWFFYGLITMMWSITKDFSQLFRYQKMGMLKVKRKKLGTEFVKLLIAKVIYFTLLVVIPLVFVNVGWGYILTGYLLMHVICGIIISVIFQLAHVVPEMKFPLPDKSGNIEDDWAIHQLNTTSNFAKNNKIVSWFVGGLNHQIEHHLFPNICHIHYRKISDIVKETAKEFNVSYFEIPTLREAIKLHARELKILGQPN